MPVRVTVDLRGAGKVQNVLRKLREQVDPGELNRVQLMTHIGLTVLRWVDRNFASGGGLVGGWRPLRPLTVFGRRQGSSVPLADTGVLRSGFTYQATAEEVVVGTASRIAPFQQFGTGPYTIRPRIKHALAFPAPPGGGGGLFLRRQPFGTPRVGVVSTAALRSTGRKAPPGRGAIQSFAVVKVVHHPGLPARRMLPVKEEIMPDIQATIQDWVNEVMTRAEREGA